MTDQEIILKIKNKNQENTALNYIYQEYFELIKGSVLRWGGNIDDASDLFQEAILVLYKNIKEEKFQLLSSIKSYLLGIAKNTWLTRKKKERLQLVSLSNDFDIRDDSSVMLKLFEKEKQVLLEGYRRKLNHENQLLVRLFFEGGYSIPEISDELGHGNIQSTRNKKSRSLKYLKAMIIKSGKESFLKEELV